MTTRRVRYPCTQVPDPSVVRLQVRVEVRPSFLQGRDPVLFLPERGHGRDRSTATPWASGWLTGPSRVESVVDRSGSEAEFGKGCSSTEGFDNTPTIAGGRT